MMKKCSTAMLCLALTHSITTSAASPCNLQRGVKPTTLSCEPGPELHDLLTVRRSPSTRAEALSTKAESSTLRGLHKHLANTPLIEVDALPTALRIAGFTEGRRMATQGDLAYLDSNLIERSPSVGTEFTILRAATPITDPDNGEVLALSLRRIGQAIAQSDATGNIRVAILSASEEVLAGDHLMPNERQAALALILPHPAVSVSGKIAAIMSGARWASQNELVVLNRGARDGLDQGSTLNVLRPVKIKRHESTRPAPTNALPYEAIARLLVLQVRQRAALAIVTQASEGFAVADLISNASVEDR